MRYRLFIRPADLLASEDTVFRLLTTIVSTNHGLDLFNERNISHIGVVDHIVQRLKVAYHKNRAKFDKSI